LPASMWAGDQGIFVYASIAAAVSLGLTLNDVSIQTCTHQTALNLAHVPVVDLGQNKTVAWQDATRQSDHSEGTTPERIAVSRINERLLSIERLLNEH
jgi:hypothetical protein